MVSCIHLLHYILWKTGICSAPFFLQDYCRRLIPVETKMTTYLFKIWQKGNLHLYFLHVHKYFTIFNLPMSTWKNLLLILRKNIFSNIVRISIPRLPLKGNFFFNGKSMERKTDNFRLNKEAMRLSDSVLWFYLLYMQK